MANHRYQPLFSRVLPISSLLLLVLFKFQNCAPSPQAVASVDPDMDGEVRIIDRWSEQKVAFLSSTVSLPLDQNAVDLHGLCVGSVEGQLIEYQVIAVRDVPQITASGLVECVGGGFELMLRNLQASSCDESFRVRAARLGDEANYAEALLRPLCADL